jgi:hypothetical protein
VSPPARVPLVAIPTRPGGAEDEISDAEDGSLHPRNDPSFTRNESLYSEDGMERAPDESLYSKDGMDRVRNESLYSEDGMEYARNESLYAQAGMDRARTRSLYSEDRPYFGQDWSKFGGKKRVVSAANAC